MNYRLKEVKEDEYSGYKVFEDDKRYYSVYVKRNGQVDQTTWATLNKYGERDMPIFTREYCEYQGEEREIYDTVTIV